MAALSFVSRSCRLVGRVKVGLGDRGGTGSCLDANDSDRSNVPFASEARDSDRSVLDFSIAFLKAKANGFSLRTESSVGVVLPRRSEKSLFIFVIDERPWSSREWLLTGCSKFDGCTFESSVKRDIDRGKKSENSR